MGLYAEKPISSPCYLPFPLVWFFGTELGFLWDESDKVWVFIHDRRTSFQIWSNVRRLKLINLRRGIICKANLLCYFLIEICVLFTYELEIIALFQLLC